MSKYPFNIAWSEDDGEFIATCSSFSGLSAFGETEEEALHEAKIALQLFIESYEERGISHERAARMASNDGVSLDQYINNASNREVSSEETI